MEYEKRIVCYLDLLGFKNSILESTENKDVRNRILDALNEINSLHENFQKTRNYTLVPHGEIRNGFTPHKVYDSGLISNMSFFSDSVIFSYKSNENRDDLMDVLIPFHEIALFAFSLLLRGFFVRGGMSYGYIYHEGNVCFGPALVKSVLLEENAVYPRISIDPNFFDETSADSVYFSRNNIYERNRSVIEDTYHCVDINGCENEYHNLWEVRKDKQLIHYLDFLDCTINYDQSIALKAKKIIENELNKTYPQRIMDKYIWFKDYYNSVVYNVQCMNEVKIT